VFCQKEIIDESKKLEMKLRTNIEIKGKSVRQTRQANCEAKRLYISRQRVFR